MLIRGDWECTLDFFNLDFLQDFFAMEGRHQELSQSRVFRAAIATPIGMGLALFAVIFLNTSDLVLCGTSDCINNFIDLYKIPIAVAGLAIPLSAIAAAIHRSKETAIQIFTSQLQAQTTIQQNTFNNYIKHKEDFFDFLERIAKRYECQFEHPHKLYTSIYPENSYDNFSPYAGVSTGLNRERNCEILNTLSSDASKMFTRLVKHELSDDEIYDYYHDMTQTARSIGLRAIAKPVLSLDDDRESELVWTEEISRTHFRNFRVIAKELSSFGMYKRPKTEGNPRKISRRGPLSPELVTRNHAAIDNFLNFKKTGLPEGLTPHLN